MVLEQLYSSIVKEDQSESLEKAMKKSKVQKWVVENYSHLNDDEVEIFISTKTKEDYVELFEEHGKDKKQIKELLKK